VIFAPVPCSDQHDIGHLTGQTKSSIPDHDGSWQVLSQKDASISIPYLSEKNRRKSPAQWDDWEVGFDHYLVFLLTRIPSSMRKIMLLLENTTPNLDDKIPTEK
jgi:hypothetical protein